MELYKISEKKSKGYHTDYETVELDDVIEWFLEHYEGIEHLTDGGSTRPETWYTITSILRRCLQRIKKSKSGGQIK